jgi:tRNA threonylcarbamoyl adenosine modification protein YeaZ
MRILAIDTSCGAASAAVYDDVMREMLAQETIAMAQGHAEALGPMVQRVMGQVEGGFSTIGRVAACIGPGSFTGIRIGLAMARAIALTIEAPTIGVTTFVAFAGPLLAEPKPGVIATAIDAKHGQVYFQLFEATGRPILAPMIASLREVVRVIGAGPARLAGNAAAMVAEEAERAGLVFDASQASVYPDIVSIARVGLAADPEAFPARPLYVKAPDAHPSPGDAIARTQG